VGSRKWEVGSGEIGSGEVGSLQSNRQHERYEQIGKLEIKSPNSYLGRLK
jgi:hypothetical protein